MVGPSLGDDVHPVRLTLATAKCRDQSALGLPLRRNYSAARGTGNRGDWPMIFALDKDLGAVSDPCENVANVAGGFGLRIRTVIV